MADHSYAFKNNIHNHSDAYYALLLAKDPSKKITIEALKTSQRQAYQAYQANLGMRTSAHTQDVKNRLQIGGAGLNTPHTGDRQSGIGAQGVLKSSPANATSATKDGYTIADAASDMVKLAHTNGTTVPTGKSLLVMAQAVIDGVNANFSGKNGIGDYSQVSGTKMAKTLIASAYQESKFGTAGQDAGGLLQVYSTRLQDYNSKFGTNYSQAQLAADNKLGAQVATWAMANPTTNGSWKMVEHQAGSVSIPDDLAQKALYFWNYNPNPGHGHANELQDYMQETSKWLAQIS